MKKINVLTRVIIFAMLIATAQAGEIQFDRQWAVEIGDNKGGSPVLFPNEINPTDIVVLGKNGKLYRINSGGEIVFCYDLGEPTTCSPAVGDLDGDGKAEVVVASTTGMIHCVDEQGKQQWQFPAHSRIDYTLALADMDGDGALEIVANSESGWLHCLNANGSLRWKFKAEPQSGPAAIGDVNNDGVPEIIFGSDLQKIYCLDNQGNYIWHVELSGNFGRSLPLIVDIDNDGEMEVLITRSEVCPNSAVIAIDGATGKILWEAPTTMHGYGPLAAADIDDDGVLDILVVDKSTTIYCITPSGERKWARTMLGHGMFYPPAVADFNGDGEMELIVGIRRGKELIILNNRGEIINRIALNGGGNSSPTVADLDGNGKLELYMLTQRPGLLVKLEVEQAQKKGEVKWATWRVDSRRSGFIPGRKLPASQVSRQIPVKQRSKFIETISALMGENKLLVPISPDQRRTSLMLQTRLTTSNGQKIVTLDFINPEQDHVFTNYRICSFGDNHLELTLLNRDTRDMLNTIHYKVCADNFQADLQFLRHKIAQLDSLMNSLPVPNLADEELLNLQKLILTSQQHYLKDNVIKFRKMKREERETFISLIEQKRKIFNRQQLQLNLLVQQRTYGNNLPFVCWEDPNPWDDEPPHRIYPQTDLRNSALTVRALGNETESRALYLTNLSNKALFLKLKPVVWFDESGKKANVKNILEFREGIEVGTVMKTTVTDALPRLNEGNMIVVPAMGNRQLWLTFKTHGLKAGTYNADLILYALGIENPQQKVKLKLVVSSVSLPQKSRFALYTWPHLGPDPDDEMTNKRFQDLIAHGNNVFSISAPVQHYDGEGNLIGEVDWRTHDAWMLKFKGKGMVLITSFQYSVRGPKDAPLWSESWEKAYQARLKRYVAHLRELGFSYQDFALYPVDEPWLTGMENVEVLLRCARLAKQADPNVQIYCDPAGMPTAENSAELVPYVDIWMPQIDLLKREDKSLLNFYKSTAATIWTYEAPGPTKLLKPLGLYRMQPWLAFRYGLTGSGMWTYNYKNIWPTKQPAPFYFSYCIVYEDGETLVTSRRWEAYRDGVEDYNLLTLLCEEIEKKRQSGASRELVEQAKNVLEEAVAKITEKQESAESINRLIIEYDPDYGQLLNYREKLIDMVRLLQR